MFEDQDHEWIFETLAIPGNDYLLGGSWRQCGGGLVWNQSIRDHLADKPESYHPVWKVAMVYQENGEEVVVLSSDKAPPRRFRRRI